MGRVQSEKRVYDEMPTFSGQEWKNESSKEIGKEFSGRRE